MNAFGLTDKALQQLFAVFAQHEQVQEVVLYGSRAKGTYTPRSDVDLVIRNSPINRQTLSRVISEINDSNFPYMVDIQVFESIQNPDLIEHIQRMGKIIYRNKEA